MAVSVLFRLLRCSQMFEPKRPDAYVKWGQERLAEIKHCANKVVRKRLSLLRKDTNFGVNLTCCSALAVSIVDFNRVVTIRLAA
jgi:hypothetical protein